MLADDFAQRRVREALLVVAEERGRVDARQNRRLTRSALRSPSDAERRVGSDERAAEGQARLFALKDRERRRLFAEQVERVVRPARAYAEAVNED